MYQAYTSVHSPVPQSAHLTSTPGPTAGACSIVNNLRILAGEDSFWFDVTASSVAIDGAVSFVVRADSLTKRSQEIVFSAEVSAEIAGVAGVPFLFRVEGAAGMTSFQYRDPDIVRCAVPDYSIDYTSPTSAILSLRGCTSFSPVPTLDPDNVVYFGFGIAFPSAIPTNVSGVVSLRCNVAERIPHQPLKV